MFRLLESLFLKDRLFKSSEPYHGFAKKITYPYFARRVFNPRAAIYDKLMLIARRPPDD